MLTFLGRSPDLWIIAFLCLPSFPVTYKRITSHLQWPDRLGFSPNSLFIFEFYIKEPKNKYSVFNFNLAYINLNNYFLIIYNFASLYQFILYEIVFQLIYYIFSTYTPYIVNIFNIS